MPGVAQVDTAAGLAILMAMGVTAKLEGISITCALAKWVSGNMTLGIMGTWGRRSDFYGGIAITHL